MVETTTARVEEEEIVDDERFVLPKKDLGDAEMDITPMIDITFLLLIFFLVASKLDESADVSLPPARRGVPVASKDAVSLVVKKAGADSVEVTTGHGKKLSSDIKTQEDEIAQYVANGLDGGGEFSEMKHHVLIRAARGIKFREVDRVSRACGRGKDLSKVGAQLPSLHIAVLEVQ